ncbi:MULTISPECIES: hypothetical protein [Streptomyces]|uniref:hypothetical protein n=1 Tax=Streptomyces TaxID=1883 RepID=UPI0004CD5BB7|nr:MULTISPECIES: hypothetical protein [Streptomyces]KOT47257.1 hypothetical protein ADK43_39860 [Streptomyces rimosus subsp. rimosus]
MTAFTMSRERITLAHDAQDISDALARFAKDVDKGIATGEANRIAQDVQQLLIRASRLAAVRETSELYAADRDDEE